MASAFVLEVQSQLQPDPNEETAALLRVLLYKADNTTFGGQTPTIPQWTGPPHTIVQVQAMLYASLAASLLSAFFAMLGKQWLNRYDSADMRGSAIERSQNRQRKYNGIVNWYFNYVMESLPLMLQAALLLLGCALSLYLWDINNAVASVTLGVTSFGIMSYLLILVAGTASASCPYQTPGSRILRSVASAVSTTVSVCGRAVGRSHTAAMLRLNLDHYQPSRSRNQIQPFLKDVFREAPRSLALDTLHLGRAVLWIFLAPFNGIRIRLFGINFASTKREPNAMELHCVLWVLHTSLDKNIHLVALEYLTTIVALTGLTPTLVVDCFNLFISCIKVTGNGVVITPGSERLAEVSAAGLLRTFTQLSAADPTPRTLMDIHQRYVETFPFDVAFDDLPFFHTFGAVHSLFHRYQRYWWVRRMGSVPPNHEHVMVIHALTDLAKSKYRRGRNGQRKVPRWILSLVMQSLSQELPTSATVDCLSLIAMELGCDTLDAKDTALDERCAHSPGVLTTLTQD